MNKPVTLSLKTESDFEVPPAVVPERKWQSFWKFPGRYVTVSM